MKCTFPLTAHTFCFSYSGKTVFIRFKGVWPNQYRIKAKISKAYAVKLATRNDSMNRCVDYCDSLSKRWFFNDEKVKTRCEQDACRVRREITIPAITQRLISMKNFKISEKGNFLGIDVTWFVWKSAPSALSKPLSHTCILLGYSGKKVFNALESVWTVTWRRPCRTATCTRFPSNN